MSKTNSVTREECASVNQKIMEKIDHLTEKVGDITVQLAELPGNLIEKLDGRYADKKTEKAVDRVTWLVISAVIIAGLALIFKK